MNDKQYTTVTGVIQFDPSDRTVNGKPVREVLIRSIASGESVRVTVWDNYADVPMRKGDAIFADGSVTRNPVTKADGSTVTYNNLSCTALIVIPGAVKQESNNTAQSNPVF